MPSTNPRGRREDPELGPRACSGSMTCRRTARRVVPLAAGRATPRPRSRAEALRGRHGTNARSTRPRSGTGGCALRPARPRAGHREPTIPQRIGERRGDAAGAQAHDGGRTPRRSVPVQPGHGRSDRPADLRRLGLRRPSLAAPASQRSHGRVRRMPRGGQDRPHRLVRNNLCR